MNPEKLLKECAVRMESTSSLADDAHDALRRWYDRLAPKAHALRQRLTGQAELAWQDTIIAHPAHRHPWYAHLRDLIGIDAYARFLWENQYFPGFIPLLQKIHQVQICDEGREAIARNLRDEHVPAPHKALMGRIMAGVRQRASASLSYPLYGSLTDRTLVFYYGYYCDPWHLVGALFATELMAVYRVRAMGAGLRRLGLDEHELEFITIHADCDEHHAREWYDCVIIPSIARKPVLRTSIIAGIADCLWTSERYLDELLMRERKDTHR